MSRILLALLAILCAAGWYSESRRADRAEAWAETVEAEAIEWMEAMR